MNYVKQSVMLIFISYVKQILQNGLLAETLFACRRATAGKAVC